MSLTVSISQDDAEFRPDFVFKYRGDVEIDMEFSTDGIYANNWANFLGFIRLGTNYSLDYCNSNGIVAISHNGFTRQVTFDVGKYGAGGDGRITVKIDATKCIDIFELVVEVLRLYDYEPRIYTDEDLKVIKSDIAAKKLNVN